MNRRLIILILFALVLVWNFVLFPSKIEFSDRTKVLQGLSFAKPYKEAIANYWKAKGQLPTQEEWQSETLIAIEILDKSLVESIIVSEEVSGSISIYYTKRKDPSVLVDIEGKKIVLTPSVESGEIKWKCMGTLAEDLLPVACQ
jgi:hypothetical protein